VRGTEEIEETRAGGSSAFSERAGFEYERYIPSSEWLCSQTKQPQESNGSAPLCSLLHATLDLQHQVCWMTKIEKITTREEPMFDIYICYLCNFIIKSNICYERSNNSSKFIVKTSPLNSVTWVDSVVSTSILLLWLPYLARTSPSHTLVHI
jgi:hypothetical protein